MSYLSGILILLNRLFDAIAIHNAKQALIKTQQKREQIQDDPINEFENMFGSAVNDDLGVRKPSDNKAVRSDTTATDLDKK